MTVEPGQGGIDAGRRPAVRRLHPVYEGCPVHAWIIGENAHASAGAATARGSAASRGGRADGGIDQDANRYSVCATSPG